jgi:hypothetical protein
MEPRVLSMPDQHFATDPHSPALSLFLIKWLQGWLMSKGKWGERTVTWQGIWAGWYPLTSSCVWTLLGRSLSGCQQKSLVPLLLCSYLRPTPVSILHPAIWTGPAIQTLRAGRGSLGAPWSSTVLAFKLRWKRWTACLSEERTEDLREQETQEGKSRAKRKVVSWRTGRELRMGECRVPGRKPRRIDMCQWLICAQPCCLMSGSERSGEPGSSPRSTQEIQGLTVSGLPQATSVSNESCLPLSDSRSPVVSMVPTNNEVQIHS